MKKTFTFLCFLLFVTVSRAQLTETEPNDSMSTANFLPFDSVMTGNVSHYLNHDMFKVKLPVNGTLRVITGIQATGGKQALNLGLNSRTGKSLGLFSPKLDTGKVRIDTLYFYCIAADSFYIDVDPSTAFPTSYQYSISLAMLETAHADGGLNNTTPQGALFINESQTVTNQLGFKHEPGTATEANYFKLVMSGDGDLNIITNTDVTKEGSHGLNVTLYDKNMLLLDSIKNSIGAFGTPVTDTAKFNCLKGDTFYIRVNQTNLADCGWSYTLSYNVLKPIYNADVEPNDSFEQATLQPIGQFFSGNIGFSQNVSDDYFMILKPDAGFLQILVDASSTDTINGKATVTLINRDRSPRDSKDVRIGSYGQFGEELIFQQALPIDTYYIKVKWATGARCGSYRILATTETISAIQDNELVPVSVFPNPSNGSFTFDLAGTQVNELQLFDVQGQLVETITSARLQSRYVVVGKQLPSGIYFARLYGNRALGTVKLVKTGM